MWRYLKCKGGLTRRAELACSFDNPNFLVDGHLRDGAVCERVGVIPRTCWKMLSTDYLRLNEPDLRVVKALAPDARRPARTRVEGRIMTD